MIQLTTILFKGTLKNMKAIFILVVIVYSCQTIDETSSQDTIIA
ncbi:MAG: hypothetical protein AAF518_17645 [Spirochaetota bacterium]